jgi:hypothetical protein
MRSLTDLNCLGLWIKQSQIFMLGFILFFSKAKFENLTVFTNKSRPLKKPLQLYFINIISLCSFSILLFFSHILYVEDVHF